MTVDPHDQYYLDQIEQALENGHSGDPLLDTLAQMQPQADPAFADNLATTLIATLQQNNKQTDSEEIISMPEKMKAKRSPRRALSLLTIAAALFAIVIAGGLLLVNPPAQETAAPVNTMDAETQFEAVVVARTQIDYGAQITEDMLTVIMMQDSVSRSWMQDREGIALYTATDQVVGQYAMRAIAPLTPITSDLLKSTLGCAPDDPRGCLPVAAGRVAITAPLARAMGQMIAAGTPVDIHAALPFSDETGEQIVIQRVTDDAFLLSASTDEGQLQATFSVEPQAANALIWLIEGDVPLWITPHDPTTANLDLAPLIMHVDRVPFIHQISADESLLSIAARYNLDPQDIRDSNPNLETFERGDYLIIPLQD